MIPDLVLLLFVGLATGIVGGYLGIGGALLITPVVLELLKRDGVPDALRFKLAFGTALLAILGTSISAATTYWRMGRVHWPAVRITGVFALLFSFLGSRLAAVSPSVFLQIFFALFALANAILLLSPIKGHTGGEVQHSASRFAVIGILAGILSAYLGIAGGVVMVPLFMFWAKIPAEKAPGTSSSIGVLTCVAGTVGYIFNGLPVSGLPAGSLGYLMPGYAIPAMVGTVAGAPLGSLLNRRFGTRVFRYVFAAFLLGVAVKILFAP